MSRGSPAPLGTPPARRLHSLPGAVGVRGAAGSQGEKPLRYRPAPHTLPVSLPGAGPPGAALEMISHMDQKEERWFSHLHAYRGKSVPSGTCPGNGPVPPSVNPAGRKATPGSPDPTGTLKSSGTGSHQGPPGSACRL